VRFNIKKSITFFRKLYCQTSFFKNRFERQIFHHHKKCFRDFGNFKGIKRDGKIKYLSVKEMQKKIFWGLFTKRDKMGMVNKIFWYEGNA